MEFSKLSSPSLKELFVREIEHMILSGELGTGDKLPSERELAEKMGVSRIVINSGMLELSKIGFVDIVPRKGAYVSDYRRKGTVDTLLAILRYNGGILKKNELKSLLELRLVLEVFALELGIVKLTEEDYSNLSGKLESFRRSNSPRESSESIFSFHHELCIISGNTMLPLIFYSFKELSTMLWERYFQLYGKDTLLSNTEELMQCLFDRNLDGAIETFKKSMVKTIDGDISIYYE